MKKNPNIPLAIRMLMIQTNLHHVSKQKVCLVSSDAHEQTQHVRLVSMQTYMDPTCVRLTFLSIPVAQIGDS